jgi:hypothetical protein
MIELIKYQEKHFDQLMILIKNEGDEWSSYTDSDKQDLYKFNLSQSIAYLLYKDDLLIGYIRAIEDDHYCIYICDLLIDKNHRSNQYGILMINHLKHEYSDKEIYVMSDVDEYYLKQGLEKIGSIFKV